MTEPTAPDALTAAIAEVKDDRPTLEVSGQTFVIERKPPTLLLAELARTGSGDPEAVGVIGEFFEVTLGKDAYRSFKRAVYSVEVEDDREFLFGLLREVVEKTTGRPTA